LLTYEEAYLLTTFVKDLIITFLREDRWIEAPRFESEKLGKKRGVFVSLKRVEGIKEYTIKCVGYLFPLTSLVQAVMDAAMSIAIYLSLLPESEVDKNLSYIFEVSILTPPRLITVDKPLDYLNKIKLGRDGLLVEKGFFKGLILPQIPKEKGWNKEEFLSECCVKAGLLADSWLKKEVKVYSFQAQILKLKPDGEFTITYSK